MADGDIASLTLKIDALQATLAKEQLDRLSESGKKAGEAGKLVEEAFKKVAAILGPLELLKTLYENTKQAIEMQSAYARLGEVAGTTASKMSSFDLPARLAGSSIDAVAQSIARLSKAVGEARLDKDSSSGQLLKALGIDVTDGRDAAAYFEELARVMGGMKDQTIASTGASQLLGRSFAELRPLFNEIIEAGELHAAVTDEQARRSKELEDAFTKMKFQMDQNWGTMVEHLIPAMQEIFAVTQDNNKEMGTWAKTGEVVGVVLKGLTSLALYLAEGFYQMGSAIGAVAASLEAVGHGEFKRAGAVWKEFNDDVAKHFAETNDKISKLWDGRAEQAVKVAEETQKVQKEAHEKENQARSQQAEARLRQLVDDRKHYEERINLLKAAGEKFANEMKVQNQLAELEYKRAGEDNLSTQTALMLKQAENNKRSLEQQIQYLEQRRALSIKMGDTGKAGEATGEIGKLNQQLIDNERLTQAQIQTLRAETGRKMQDQYGTEQEIENRAYALKLKALNAYLDAEGDAVTNANQLRERLEVDHQAALGDISAQGQQVRMKFDQSTFAQQAEYLTNFFVTTTSAASAHNKRMFQMNKIAGEAQIVVSTSIAAMKAYEMGPYLGPVLAGLVIAAGAVQLNNLRKATFDGGGSVAPSTTSSAGGATPVFPVGGSAPPPASSSQAGSSIMVNVTIEGNMLGNQEFVDNIMLPAIKDAVDNRDFEIMGPNSRNADKIRNNP